MIPEGMGGTEMMHGIRLEANPRQIQETKKMFQSMTAASVVAPFVTNIFQSIMDLVAGGFAEPAQLIWDKLKEAVESGSAAAVSSLLDTLSSPDVQAALEAVGSELARISIVGLKTADALIQIADSLGILEGVSNSLGSTLDKIIGPAEKLSAILQVLAAMTQANVDANQALIDAYNQQNPLASTTGYYTGGGGAPPTTGQTITGSSQYSEQDIYNMMGFSY